MRKDGESVVARSTVVLGVLVWDTRCNIVVLLVDNRDDKTVLLEGVVPRGLSPNSCSGCRTTAVLSMKTLIRTANHSILLDDDT